MFRVIGAIALLGVLSACGGGGGDSTGANPSTNPNLPTNAVAMETSLRKGMVATVQRMTGFESALLFMLNPGSPGAPLVSGTPDTTPGAAPFSFTYSGDYDGNFDGHAETRIAGRSAFTSDPNSAFNGVSGQATIDITILGLLHVYHADLAFTLGTDERRISGTGTFRDPMSGNTTTMTVEPAQPLRIVLATGATANGCGYVLDGDLRLVVAGPQGTYASTWHFAPGASTAVVGNATHTDAGGVVTAMPATDVDVGCGTTAGTISDWSGVYLQDWACLPIEFGKARLALTVKNASTVTINDEDPPGSGNGNIYEASIIGSSARSLRGFFVAGDVGNRYREDFNWTLSPDNQRFMQASRYVYQEGPNLGNGGNCVARAKRTP